MISVVDLRKSFIAPNGERIEVLRGVTFEAHAGESIAITGASGSGKSTLLHLLGGLEAPDHGNITLDGHRKEIGFVFQFHYLLPDLSAVENVALPLLIARWKKKRAFDRAMELLLKTGLGERAEHPISHLSGGEQQRVAVARALVNRPKLVLADEPTGNLDRRHGREALALIREVCRENGAALLLVSHDEEVLGAFESRKDFVEINCARAETRK